MMSDSKNQNDINDLINNFDKCKPNHGDFVVCQQFKSERHPVNMDFDIT